MTGIKQNALATTTTKALNTPRTRISGRFQSLAIWVFAAVLVLSCSVRPAGAATATSTMAVSATVVATCSISTTSLAFGNYTGAALPGSALLTALCSNGSTYNIGLSAGTSTNATVTTRGMFVSGTPAVVLNYALYSNSARTTNWGSTVGTDTVSGTGNGASQSLTVYGNIPAGQFIAAGSYTDSIVATITY
ncbi:spore coat U domain-containing protein [Acidipila sp. EB88]|uniref:Csu type fimbrial protein n=1 Tax=Acidipila sp. EB88 TaxID=2305226 RepID=UPI000F601B4B|nr:spore coat U domain-containing protein [Acidipila sp. EB88]RRA50256.1 spore coat U domain-containing protein [Acidipila sp. EB88]